MQQHEYPEPDEEEGFLWVREMETDELKEEFDHATRVLAAFAGELEFRDGDPRYQPNLTGDERDLVAAIEDLLGDGV